MLNSLNFISRRLYASPRRVLHPRPWTFRSASKLSTQHATLTENTSTKDEQNISIRELLLPVKMYLQEGHEALASSHFLQGLKKLRVDNPRLFRAYEIATALFLRSNYPLSAAVIYGHMTSLGFIPSVSLRTQMHIIKLAQSFPDEFTLLQEFKDAFRLKSFNEDALRDLLHLLTKSMQCTPDFIDKVVRTFIGTRAPGYTLNTRTVSLLVRIHSHAGSVADAQRWISEQTDASKSPRPYTVLVGNLSAADPNNAEIYKWVVERMKEYKIEADLAFYNVTLSLWLSHDRFRPVFELYRILRHSGQLGLLPDAYTYGILFSAMRRVRWDRRTDRRHLRERLPMNAPSARVLFADMLHTHLIHTAARMGEPSPVITALVLDQALRVFMAQEDFAGACVVLWAFRTCAVAPTLTTFRVVLLRILGRIERELRLIGTADEPWRYWTYHFLGMGTYGDHAAAGGGIDGSIYEMVLRLATVPRLSLDFVPPPAGDAALDVGKHRMPSIPVFMGVEPRGIDEEWSVVPLERILRRALLATRPKIELPPAKFVEMKIATAREDMSPNRADEVPIPPELRRTFRRAMFARGNKPSE